MDVLEFVARNVRRFWMQIVRRFDGFDLVKRVAVTNFYVDSIDKRHRVFTKFSEFQGYVESQISRARELGVSLEVHISNAWYLANQVFLYDIVIDIERMPIKQTIYVAEKAMNLLRAYGLRPVAKISSIVDNGSCIEMGIHIHVDLSSLVKTLNPLPAEVVEKWSTFYNNLIERIKLATGLDFEERRARKQLIDKAFGSECHLVRAFLSPKIDEDTGDFLNISIPIDVDEIKNLLEQGKERKLLERAQDLETCNRLRVPRSGVENPKLFAKLFNALADTKIEPRKEEQSDFIELEEEYSHEPRYRGVSAKNFEYIEKVVERGLPDGRKRFILYVLSRYLINVKQLSDEDAMHVIHRFIENSCRNFGNCGKIYDSWIRSVLKGVRTKNFMPYKLETLCTKEEHADLCNIIMSILKRD